VVLGEGYNTAWTASDASGSLGPPTLVDGNANGWRIAPTDQPTTITFHWTAQRTLNIALMASVLGLLACIALVVADRRRDGDALVPVPVPRPFPPSQWGTEAVGAATVIVTTLASAVLIGWIWGVVALALSLVAFGLRRQRLLALVGFLIVVAAQCYVVLVVRRNRPFPGAGFPDHFEWLHPWTLLGVVLLTCSALVPGRSRRSP
jgi:arabinofuranan 3-O-arabinosyltransferase